MVNVPDTLFAILFADDTNLFTVYDNFETPLAKPILVYWVSLYLKGNSSRSPAIFAATVM